MSANSNMGLSLIRILPASSADTFMPTPTTPFRRCKTGLESKSRSPLQDTACRRNVIDASARNELGTCQAKAPSLTPHTTRSPVQSSCHVSVASLSASVPSSCHACHQTHHACNPPSPPLFEIPRRRLSRGSQKYTGRQVARDAVTYTAIAPSGASGNMTLSWSDLPREHILENAESAQYT